MCGTGVHDSYSVNQCLLITYRYNRSALLLIQREQCSIQATTDEGDEATQRAGGPRGEGLRALGPALLSRFGKKPNLHFHGGRGRTNKQEPRRPSMLRSSAGAALADPRFFERTVPLPSRVVNTTAAEVCSPAAAMSAAQRGAWSRVFAALRSGGTVSVVMLGGSMARGQGCTEDESAHVSCSYSGRLVAWLRRAYPRAKVFFENRAVGGMTTGVSLLSLPSLAMPVSMRPGRKRRAGGGAAS